MSNKSQMRLALCLSLGISVCVSINAQKAIPRNLADTADLAAVAPPVPSRVVERVDDSRLITLHGNTHPLARPQYDQGLADPQLPMERIVLLLKRSPQQEAALEAFMAEQYDPKSPNFHHWLQPEEFGKLYGPSDSDIAAVTSWLQNHGFQIYIVNKGRVTIEFSGTAAQVQQTFHTEMHHYLVNGKKHLANDRDPQIPLALAPVIAGVASLHDFFPKHQSILGRYVRRDPKTGHVTPVEPQPQYYIGNEQGNPMEDITPYDFATIYNLLPLWNAGITGKGQTIAISAVTDINASDVSNFRSTFGLSGFTGAINQIHNGTDPGVVQGALVENTLDTEWSGATAPDANVDVVVSASTSTTFGGILSDQYIVEHPSLFTIMSASYGGCEIGLGTSGNSTMNSIYQQGSAAGISMFESSGDQGSTGCDNSDATTFPNPAQYGLNVNGDASSPYITAVGGTEFTWLNERTAYWTDSNSSTNLSDAKGYIPEAPWNGTCTNQMELDRFWSVDYNLTTLEQVCNAMVGYGVPDFVTVTGGSGGVSSCIASSGGEFSSCAGGYAQPSYQKGVQGMPGTEYRYLPDVSLFASSGFPYGFNGSAYLICVASNSKEDTCNYSDNTQIVYQEVGGTSVSSPALAGIMALVQQKQNGAPQGLANPVFYSLFSKENLSNCNSSTVTNGNACIFYDVTYGNNAQVCTTGSRDCVTGTSGDTYGIVSGYTTTTGYDQATGLGSVNATNLVNNWPSTATGAPAVTLTPTSLSFPSTAVGATSAGQSITVKNTGNATLTISNIEITGTDYTSYNGTSTCNTTLAAGATCTVTVTFEPTATGTLTASVVLSDNAGSGSQTATLTGTGGTTTSPAVTFTPTRLAFPSTAVGSTSASQTITVKNTGTAALTFTDITFSGANTTSFGGSSTCTTAIAPGASCTMTVDFAPKTAGTLTASVVFTDNAAGSPQSVPLTGTGTTTALAGTLSPTSIAFPATAVGATSATQVVTFKNTGTSAIAVTSYTITGTGASSFVLTAHTCGTSLAVGASCTLTLAFKPAATGALTATLNANDNIPGSPQKVTLTGTGGATALAGTLSPTSLAFPATTVGATSATQIVTFKNTGSSAITVSSYTFSGTDASSFVLTAHTCGTSLAVGASCTLTVAFKPATTGALTATLNANDNIPGSPQKVTLTGTGGSSSTSSITLSPNSIAFPATIAGATSDAQIVTLSNAGSATVTLHSITLAGTNPVDFEKLTNCGATLAAKASCSIYVAFKPASAANFTATLSVADSASGSPQSVALSGTGTGTPSVKLSTTGIAFPTTAHGTHSDAQAVTLTNSGAATLTLTSITLTGANPTDFVAINNCANTLAANASCTVYVAFAPASAAAFKATLSITDNGSASPQSVALSGTGD